MAEADRLHHHGQWLLRFITGCFTLPRGVVRRRAASFYRGARRSGCAAAGSRAQAITRASAWAEQCPR